MATRGEHERGHELAGFPHLRDDAESVDAREHDVQDHDVEGSGLGLQLFERGFAGIYQLDLVAFGFQVKTKAFGEVLFVFHDENSAHFVNFTMGSCKMKVLPRPGPSLSAQARPPCRLATDRTM